MDDKLASRLIESILMDVPIPVIYLAEEKDGTFSVIDGQQRLTSFISFLEGSFPDGQEFRLKGLQILKEQNRKKFSELERQYQTKVKTTTIHTIIIKKESQEDIKFEIFERLNTGSIKLNEDEIRNTIYRGDYINLLARLENNDTFHSIVKKDNFKKRMIYRGMLLRFFALSEKTYINYKPSVKQFCNKELRDNQFMNNEKRKEYEDRFKKCIELVSIVFGDNAFRRFIPGNKSNKNGEWATRINMALFDIQMCGFVNFEKSQVVPKADEIREAMIRLMSYNDEFINSIEIKTSDKDQMTKRFEIWYSTLREIIGNTRRDSRVFPFSLKKELFDNDPTCKICKQQILLIEDAEVDHIVPYSEGGETIKENAQITHRYCNRVKGNDTQGLNLFNLS
ncbi:DUF262 domain-containing protein [Bacillus sp. ISL-75]|uniref:GmrSD restriction endonuclease domain-containing protein n=1 Tax=Bacillus sp. ISL-75 TaxID=2819137 RepID=UPI001BE7A2CA|nr:DUF262 domain-containing protein [Bacillus sp. ISL-75]MBT2728570.1 DUF262 domain-containing protein [Bacillus sp. ISL-75]